MGKPSSRVLGRLKKKADFRSKSPEEQRAIIAALKKSYNEKVLQPGGEREEEAEGTMDDRYR